MSRWGKSPLWPGWPDWQVKQCEMSKWQAISSARFSTFLPGWKKQKQKLTICQLQTAEHRHEQAILQMSYPSIFLIPFFIQLIGIPNSIRYCWLFGFHLTLTFAIAFIYILSIDSISLIRDLEGSKIKPLFKQKSMRLTSAW